MNLSYYLRKIEDYPAHIILYKILVSLCSRLKILVLSVKASLSSTYISDKEFLASLNDPYDDIGELLKHMKERQFPDFFFRQCDKDILVQAVKCWYPDAIQQTIADADKICNHVFNLLGSGKTYLGEEIDWHIDFKTGWKWEPRYYRNIKCRESPPER